MASFTRSNAVAALVVFPIPEEEVLIAKAYELLPVISIGVESNVLPSESIVTGSVVVLKMLTPLNSFVAVELTKLWSWENSA